MSDTANVRSADFNYITGFEQQDILKIHWYESRPKGQIERKAMNKVENKSGLKEAAILFEGWQEGIIWSCLQGIMGEICVEEGENPESAAAHLGDFCFLAGEPDRELVEDIYRKWGQKFLIAVPQNEGWGRLIEEVCGNGAEQITRHAIKKEPDVFDLEKLRNAAASLPEGFTLQILDKEIYSLCQREEWSRDLVSQYPDYESYSRLGTGVAVMAGRELAAGASSYATFQDGIEVEVDTKRKYRRQGLAYACSAKLILECLEKNIYPCWDAHNRSSAALAEKLGYHYDREYSAYILRA